MRDLDVAAKHIERQLEENNEEIKKIISDITHLLEVFDEIKKKKYLQKVEKVVKDKFHQ